jgi:hypothetical protein
MAGRYGEAAADRKRWPAAGGGEGDGRGSPLYEHDGTAGGEACCEGDRTYFFAGVAGSVELPQVPRHRSLISEDLSDSGGGKENLGCDCVAEAFEVPGGVLSVCEPVQGFIILVDAEVTVLVHQCEVLAPRAK